ncbi:MAG: 6-carboxytetrahydropterin synthase, partial [Bacteroidota bacterium]
GPCRNIHGHSYYLYVTVIGEPVDDPGNSCNGMVMDFNLLKKIIAEAITNQLDHALVLNANCTVKELQLEKHFDNVVYLPYQPTCENMLTDFSQRISQLLPAGVVLHNLRLCETVTSSAEWFAGDQE